MSTVSDEQRAKRRSARRRRERLVVGAGAVVAAGLFMAAGWLALSPKSPKRHGPARPASGSRSHGVHRAVRVPWPIPGYLLIADRGNNRALLVDVRHRILWRYPPRRTAPTFPFTFDDDTFFGPGLRTIISNQEDQHTIQIISFPGGKVLWHYGHPGHAGSTAGYLRTPDDAYLLRSGLRTVADAYNCRVLFINALHRIVRQYGRARVCRHDPPRLLGAVNGATPTRDGGMLISEINGSWIDRIDASGHLVYSIRAPASYPSDPQPLPNGRIMLADYTRPGRALITDTHGRVLWTYGPHGGPGELDHPSLALPLGNDTVAINDDFRHRVVIVNMRTHRIIWQYGHTDVKGTRPGYLNTPDGLDLLPFNRARAEPRLRAILSGHPLG